MNDFATRLLAWHDHCGRKDLPWQGVDAYRVWVSEIMLQQTQVATVIPYYQRFLNRFPSVTVLAEAPQDEVLRLWAGLGYYARGRHLHEAARAIVTDHGGEIPRDLQALRALPGIGRSTAGAILALAFGERHPILDGNVRRVLSRYHAQTGTPGDASFETRLWALADAHTPALRVRDYTQAIMDLGATVCRRTPECARCPLGSDCQARSAGDPRSYPSPRRRATPPVRHACLLIVRDARGRALLTKRPMDGVWGGLWSLPECVGTDVGAWCRETLGLEVTLAPAGTPVQHRFTHFTLAITPQPVRLRRILAVMENPDLVWYNTREPEALPALAAPIRRLLTLF
ncbi:MAG: A/G-specific adenine glycosylase [Acidiferrobacteraceae bacterium]